MKRALRSLICALGLTALLAGLGYYGFSVYDKNYVNISGVSYSRELTALDLSGQDFPQRQKLTRFPQLQQLDLRQTGAPLEDILWLQQQLPRCVILWELPFQGSFYSPDTQRLTITQLTQEDVITLDHLPQLTSVDAWDCQDYEALYFLQQRRPECKVFFNVVIGEASYDCDSQAVTLADCTDPELEPKLRCLTRLEQVHFTGKIPSAQQLKGLKAALPHLDISWKGKAEGRSVDSGLENLDLSREELTLLELDQLLIYYPGLQEVYLGTTDLPTEALLALEKGHGDLLCIWDMEIEGVALRRDAEELDLSGRTIADLTALEEQLALLPRLTRVIMCGCGIPSQEMAQLDGRHENIRFIWSVSLGGILLRTDATYFAPNKYYIEVDDAAIADLQYCYDMVCIDIGHNRGVTHCQWAANMPNLKYLVIADTNIKDLTPLTNLKNLVFLEVFTSPVRDYRPLLGCTGLEDLNLGYTYGDPAPVMEMTWLKRLWWPGSLRVLTWNVRNQLRTCLPEAKMNFVAGSSTGEGWRHSPNYYAMRDLLGMEYMTG